jgi:hypothetical protein
MHRTQHNSAEWNKRLFLPWSDFSRYLIFFPVIIPCVVLYHFRRFDKKKIILTCSTLYCLSANLFLIHTYYSYFVLFFFFRVEKKCRPCAFAMHRYPDKYRHSLSFVPRTMTTIAFERNPVLFCFYLSLIFSLVRLLYRAEY